MIGAFPMARRRELFAELQPLVDRRSTSTRGAGRAETGQAPEGGSRWNPKKDLSFVPLRPERVVEVRYDYMEGARFRHPPQFVRWRPDREPGLVRLRAARAAGAVRPRRRPDGADHAAGERVAQLGAGIGEREESADPAADAGDQCGDVGQTWR